MGFVLHAMMSFYSKGLYQLNIVEIVLRWYQILFFNPVDGIVGD